MSTFDLTERPDLYDWLYADHVEDIAMYISLASGHSEVLECGIGSGRTAIPMAYSGKRVFGIDNSEAMLNRLSTNLESAPPEVRDRVFPSLNDIRHFDLNREFSFIYVPFSTFNYLLTLEEQQSALAALRKHLVNDGVLVLELLSYSLFPHWLDNNGQLVKAKRRIDHSTGEMVEMWRTFRFDSVTQIVEQDRYYRFYDAKGNLKSETVVLWRNRFFLVGEIQLLLREAGFTIENVYGNCTFGPYQHDSEFAVVVSTTRA